MEDSMRQGHAVIIKGEDIPAYAPCCAQTAEEHYRRGYYDGWRVGIWSVSDLFPDWLLALLTTFRAHELAPWSRTCRRTVGAAIDQTPPPLFRTRRLLKKRLGVKYKRRFAILKRDNYRCRLCGTWAGDGLHVRLNVDHIIARANGGTDDDDNLWTLCEPCNRGKHTSDL